MRLFCLSCRLQICGGNQKLYPDQFMSAASAPSYIYIKIANSRTHAFVSLPLPKPQINIKSDLCNVCFLRSFKDTCTFSSWVCLPAGCHATINHKYSTQPRCFPGFSVRLFKRSVPLDTCVCFSSSMATPNQKHQLVIRCLL